MERLDGVIRRCGPARVLSRMAGLAYTGYLVVAVLALLDLAVPRALGVLMVVALAAQVVAHRAADVLNSGPPGAVVRRGPASGER